MFRRFLARIRPNPEPTPEPLCRPATAYPNRSGAYGPHVRHVRSQAGRGYNTRPTWPVNPRGPQEGSRER